jgi:flagella basal body P-ring formation protein FlgA
VLVLDGGHVHIQLAVVCLENGVVGQTIRVAGRGHEQIYMAEVCSDGLLRASL